MTRARDMLIHVDYNNQELNWVNHVTGFDFNGTNVQLNFLGTLDEIFVDTFNYGKLNDYPPGRLSVRRDQGRNALCLRLRGADAARVRRVSAHQGA